MNAKKKALLEMIGDEIAGLVECTEDADHPGLRKYRYDTTEFKLMDYGKDKSLCIPVLFLYKCYIRDRCRFTLPGFDYILDAPNVGSNIQGDLRTLLLDFDTLLDNQEEQKVEMTDEMRNDIIKIRNGEDILNTPNNEIMFVLKIGGKRYKVTQKSIKRTGKAVGIYNSETDTLIELNTKEIEQEEAKIRAIQSSIIDKSLVMMREELAPEINYTISDKKDGEKCYILVHKDEIIILNSHRQRKVVYKTINKHQMTDTLILAEDEAFQYTLIDIMKYDGQDIMHMSLVDRLVALKAAEQNINEIAAIKVTTQHYEHLTTMPITEMHQMVDKASEGLVFTPTGPYCMPCYKLKHEATIDVIAHWSESKYKGTASGMEFEVEIPYTGHAQQILEMEVKCRKKIEIELVFKRIRQDKRSPNAPETIIEIIHNVLKGEVTMKNAIILMSDYQKKRISVVRPLIAKKNKKEKIIIAYDNNEQSDMWNKILDTMEKRGYDIACEEREEVLTWPITLSTMHNILEKREHLDEIMREIIQWREKRRPRLQYYKDIRRANVVKKRRWRPKDGRGPRKSKGPHIDANK